MVSKQKKKKAEERPVFDSIRKPTAPPTVKMTSERSKERSRPSLRKAKHKQPIETEE